MSIPSAELKSLVKKLSPVKSENLYLDKSSVIAWDSDLMLIINRQLVDNPITVNLRKFSTVVNRMSGDVTLELTGTHLSLKSNRIKVELERVGAKPGPIDRTDVSLLSLPLAPVKSVLSYASTSADPNKAVEGGGVVEFSSEVGGIETEQVTGLRAAGTNTMRLAVASDSTVPPGKFLYHLPLTAVAAIQTFDGETLEIGETDRKFYLRAGDVEVYAPKLVKPFPKYSAFIPTQFAFVFQVDAEAVRSALRVVEPMVDNTENACSVHFLDNSVTIRSLGSGGKAEDSADSMQITPDPVFDSADFRVLLNHRYLSDFFGAVSGPVTFSANSPKQPVLLETPGRKMMISPTVEK